MKKLLIITGFESSGSVFTARVASFVMKKCSKFGDWNGYGWNGKKGDDLIIIHRSMPYGRKFKKWFNNLEQETKGMDDYTKSYVICTRDLTISKLSRIKRFSGSLLSYKKDDLQAKNIFKKIMREEKSFVFSFESAVALGDAYYETLYKWLGKESDFSPPIFDANEPYFNK